MPNSMTHLILARKISKSGDTEYLIGNIAPDAVCDRGIKDSTHFRNITNREPALIELASKTNEKDSFSEGILIHLYLDWKWDIRFTNKFFSEIKFGGFQRYREEISLAGSHSFHNEEWSKKVWEDMEFYDMDLYGKVNGAESAEVKEFISRNHKWHSEHVLGPSSIFTPELIEEFTDITAKEYINWRKIHTKL